MPELFENVGNMIQSQLHVAKPNLTVELQQELELKLRDYIGKSVVLRYWSDSYEFQVECIIESVDKWSRVVTVRQEDDIMFVQFEHIFEVTRYDYLNELR